MLKQLLRWWAITTLRKTLPRLMKSLKKGRRKKRTYPRGDASGEMVQSNWSPKSHWDLLWCSFHCYPALLHCESGHRVCFLFCLCRLQTLLPILTGSRPTALQQCLCFWWLLRCCLLEIFNLLSWQLFSRT